MKYLKEISLLLVVILVSGYIGAMLAGGSSLGGAIHNVQESFDAGIAVDGTEIISSSGAISSTSGSYSDTLSVAGVLSVTAEGNQLGSTDVYNPIYIGAGDGCSYILFAASTTIASGATSTSFCN